MTSPALFTLEVHDPPAQARYFVRGLYDVLWSDDLDAALVFLRAAVEQLAEE